MIIVFQVNVDDSTYLYFSASDTDSCSHIEAWMMASTVTAVCRLEHAPNAELMAAFSREANNKLREFAPQNISNMLWAYATLGHSPGDAS